MAAASASNAHQVLAPLVGHVRRRLVGKQPGHVVPSAALPAMPAPKARAAAKPNKLQDDALDAEEQAQLSGLSGVRRNQMLKALQHNRTVVNSGMRFTV